MDFETFKENLARDVNDSSVLSFFFIIFATGKDAQHGSFIANYTGQMDWGELADYVEFYVFIIEGHFTVEITAMADKIWDIVIFLPALSS